MKCNEAFHNADFSWYTCHNKVLCVSFRKEIKPKVSVFFFYAHDRKRLKPSRSSQKTPSRFFFVFFLLYVVPCVSSGVNLTFFFPFSTIRTVKDF